ncbi:restriction endonuclease subunit S [Mycobacterium intermedium]|uniref:Restriction endonuclease subunit S n=1 Tax=Mycobacterium intermedium TaxID=28445 RepID=A0A1E3SBA7_MYCIE|nr:restriction endonuclease subunit S [Mycobacterium intermedium]MCV6965860.1 restriction endonuclease subunit S [Mycobacterium intermedium]ODQ99446.1 restriction endonuclease subunit S [Mycobacterium intermedium]OPE50784.1 restriction endonuclease subunit S [Mycobacterium intermedium]ORB10061.1 restriction endonuclease subunit S [Mycobacterium intermedium]
MEVKLGDQLELRSGKSPPRRAKTGPYPIYGANGVIGYAAEHNANGPLIVIGRVGSYCGSVRFCDTDVWVTENALICRARNPDETRFWYYALQTCRLNEHRSGSGQPLLNQRTLHDLSLQTVDADDRVRIAALLGALDDKIVANRRVVDAAEALMVATVASITGYVPLSELAIRSTGLVNPSDFDDVVAHFSLPAFDDGGRPQVVAGASVKSAKFLISAPCVLFAKLNPGRPRIWNVMGLPPQMALASTEFVVLSPVGIDTSALWAAVRQPEISRTLRQRVDGTSGSHQRIRPDELLDMPVRDVRRLSAGELQTITYLGELCHARRNDNVRLAALRDTLLPPLVSGELRL